MMMIEPDGSAGNEMTIDPDRSAGSESYRVTLRAMAFALSLCAPLVPAGVMANATPELGDIGVQALAVGQPWRLHVRARDADAGAAPRLDVRGMPEGASLVAEGGGWYRFDWTPPAATSGRIDLTLVAIDAADASLRSERTLRLEIAALPRTRAESDGSPAAPPAPPPPAPRMVAPVIEPPPTQIVSAGRNVSFRVAATLAEPARAILQIDRLPRHASFESNPDGSRTFFWPTADRDQGEHRFRLTASHPDDAALRSRADLVVIVGDPSTTITEPGPEGAPAPVPGVSGSDAPDTDAPAPAPSDAPAAPDDEPYLPQAGSDEADYFGPDDADYFGPGAPDADGVPYDAGADPSVPGNGGTLSDGSEPGYFDDGGGMRLGPDGQPL